jgi:hypothetical protein
MFSAFCPPNKKGKTIRNWRKSYFAESKRLSPPAISGRPKKEKIIVKRFKN